MVFSHDDFYFLKKGNKLVLLLPNIFLKTSGHLLIFNSIYFSLIIWFTACEPPNYGVNCQSICNCGQGMERCDPVTGCVCKSGWTGSDCDTDINECTTNPTICGSDKICQNLDGSHACNCRNGYEKNSNDNCIGMKW